MCMGDTATNRTEMAPVHIELDFLTRETDRKQDVFKR